MFEAKILAIKIPAKKAIIPEIKTTAKIKTKLLRVIEPSNSKTAADAPVRVLPMTKAVTKDKAITIVLIPPTKNKNSLLSCSPPISEPITAACPEPIPGRKLHKGAAIPIPKNH